MKNMHARLGICACGREGAGNRAPGRCRAGNSAGRRAGAGAQHAAQERQGNLGRLQHCGREQAGGGLGLGPAAA